MDQFLDINEVRTRYRRLGSGPDVLVLHGWAARIQAMTPILNGLASTLTVHVRRPARFWRERAAAAPAVGHADYVAWTRALITELGLERPSIVGHLRGGAIAFKLAAEYPELVEKLILINAAGIKPKRSLDYHRRVATAKVAKHVLRRLGPAGRQAQERLAARSASSDYAQAGVMRPSLVKLVNEDLTDQLRHVHAPTLLIWGEDDDATPLSHGQMMEQLIPDARLVVSEGAGHFAYLDQPRRFNTIATHFLAPPLRVT